MCLSSSLLQMPVDNQALLALRSMKAVLKDDGFLVLTQGLTDSQMREKPRFIQAVNRQDFTRIFAIDYEEKSALINVLDIFHGVNKKDLLVWSIEYKNVLLVEDYTRLLTEAGFSSFDFYGTYRYDPYDPETSDRLIVMARK